MQAPRSALLCIALVACPLACAEETAPERTIVRPVKTYVFGGAARNDRFSFPGRVHPNTTVEIAFEVTGKLAELPVSKGQRVQTGDLLARLDQRDLRNDLAASRAAQQAAVATRDRYRDAARSRAVSRQEVDEAEAMARIALADLRIKEKALEDSSIHADFDGIVADRYVENFQQVIAKEPILSLQDISTLEIRVDVPERDMVSSNAPDPGTLTAVFAAMSEREFPLEIKEVVTEADPITQTFAVTLTLPNPDEGQLLPGMTATVNYYPPEGGAGAGDDTVPSVAVVGQPDRQPWVWLIDPETMVVSRRPVEIGEIVRGDRVRIVSGLEPGEKIAAAGAHHLADGMKVREYRP